MQFIRSIQGERGRRDGRGVLLAALALGLLVRLAILAQTPALGTGIVDEQHYAQLATSIVRGDGFAWGPSEPTSIRPPLYPALVAAVWTVTGAGNLQAVRAVQIALALVTTWLVFLIGREAFEARVGRYAAAAFWLYPSLVFFNFTILTETLFTLLLMAFVLLLLMLLRSPKPAVALACGVALGLGALTRSILWPLPILLCPLLALMFDAPWRTRIAVPALVLAGFVVVVAPWAVRNTRLQGVTTIVDTMGGLNLRLGNYEHTPDDRMWDAVSLSGEKSWAYALRQEFPGAAFTEGEKDKWAQRKAIEYMLANPGITVRRALIKFADFWGIEREFIAGVQQGIFAPPSWFAGIASAAIIGGYLLIVIGGAAGIWLAPPAWRTQVVLLLPVALITGLHTIVFGHSRYHIPLMPILGIYASALAVQFAWATDWRTYHRPGVFGAAATLTVLAAVWVRQVVFVDLARIRALFEHVG